MEPVGLIVLKCPNCGSKLEVFHEMNHFACGFCGSGIVAQRRGGTVALMLEEAAMAVRKTTDKTGAELALKRLSAEFEVKARELEEKGKALQYLKYHLNDDVGGFELKPWHGVWPTLWKSAIGTAVLLAVGRAVHGVAGMAQDLALSLAIPFGLGFGIRYLLNRRNAALNAKTLNEKKETVRLSRLNVQKRIDAAQREYNELTRQVEALTDRIDKNKAIADS